MILLRSEVSFMFVNYDFPITVTRAFSVFRLLNSPIGTTNIRKGRPKWAISLKLVGKTIYTANGKEIISDSLHPVILPKGSFYTWKCVEPGECIQLEFDALEEFSEPIPFELLDNTPLVKIITKSELLLNNTDNISQIETVHLIYEALLFLMKSAEKKYTPKNRIDFLKPATDFIAGNYYLGNITNELLAGMCKISTVHFRTTFERVYGVSPIKYLNNFRIEKAKYMLQSDFDSISQVAQSVGYSSIYHFSKMFKSYTGYSPTKYALTFRK